MANNVKWHGNELLKRLEYRADWLLEECAEELRDDIKEHFTDPGDWRKWKSKSNYKTWHWSAKPYTPPAIDTGELQDSIDFDMSSSAGTLVKWRVARVGSTILKGKWQEFGTSRFLPRPFIRPAFNRYRPRFLQKIKLVGL